MVLWIGVDDTDSLRGMCTTFLATEFVRELTKDLDLIGYPRLVRLNPNIPWKTRGNGAIALAVGRGRGPPFVVGVIEGREIKAFPRGAGHGDAEGIARRLAGLVQRWADLDAEGTNPGLAVLSRKPPPSLYWRAVRGVVPLTDAVRITDGLGIRRTWKTGRGLIGAAAACAWRPRDRTWEILAYRDRARWGTPREVDPASVREMDARYPSTFNNYDYENSRIVIAPRTPCPVLFGIRGDRLEDLPRAMGTIRGEKAERWLVFLTNQGTDDHVVPRGPPIPYSAGRFPGVVSRPPRTIPGGHVVFGLEGSDVTAYEPSKQFRHTVRLLMPGDVVEVVGSVRESPRTINLEKLRVKSLATQERKVSNPLCPRCGKHAKSRGRGAPFRCVSCGGRIPRTAATVLKVQRLLEPGWYEPPTGSRRHLSKPTKRMS